jgi:hypothetical protein
MNKIHIVHMFMCVIAMYCIVSNYTQHICSKRYKQYNQSHSNCDKIPKVKSFWSYLSQFSTVFKEPGSEIDTNMCGIWGV